MNQKATKYLEMKAAELKLVVSVQYAWPHDTEIVTMMDHSNIYQFGVSGLEMLQNTDDGMEHLIDYRMGEALKKPRKPRFDSVNPPISELAQRGS